MGSEVGTLTAPDYGSGASAGTLSDSNVNTPESDGGPGLKFFADGVQAYKRGDYANAIHMYKLAAFWAYSPRAYNLGVMYFKGEGVPENRPLGAAWMIIAAEQGDPQFVAAQDQMVTVLTDAQFAETDKLWSGLKGKYGGKVAMRRPKWQWALAKSRKTGSGVGGTAGELPVGVFDTGIHSGPGPAQQGLGSAASFLGSGSVSGSLAYRQFQESNNPYSPMFLEKNRTGNATVGPLQTIKASRPSGVNAVKPAGASSSRGG
ncbi:MAG: tetratricopeptide repeat protein [Rhodanobacteraceae bacterium]